MSKQPLTPSKHLQNGASDGVALDDKKPAPSNQPSDKIIILGQNGEGGTVKPTVSNDGENKAAPVAIARRTSSRVKVDWNPFVHKAGKESMGIRASNPFDSPLRAVTTLARTATGSTALPPKTDNTGGTKRAAAPASFIGEEEGDEEPLAEGRPVRKREKRVTYTQQESQRYLDAIAAKVAAKAASAAAAAPPAAKGTDGNGLITVRGKRFDPNDFEIGTKGGKLSVPHSTLALVENVGELLTDDPSNDLQYTESGNLSVPTLRKIQEIGLLRCNKKQLYQLRSRLSRCCCEDGCFKVASSNQRDYGGDGTQCVGCFLDARDGKDRVRHGMLKSFSTLQKICVLKGLKANMWGLWKLILDAGGDVLKDKNRYDVKVCAEWLVKYGWYELREGDEERGDEWNRARASVNVDKLHTALAAKKS